MKSPRHRPTALELVSRQDEIPGLRAALEAAEYDYEAVRKRRDDLRRELDDLWGVDEVYDELIPLEVRLGFSCRVAPRGSDLEYTREARLSPILGEEDELSEDDEGVLYWPGPHLLFLSGSGWEKPYMVVPTREEGLRLAKRFAAYGAVPGPPTPPEDLPSES